MVCLISFLSIDAQNHFATRGLYGVFSIKISTTIVVRWCESLLEYMEGLVLNESHAIIDIYLLTIILAHSYARG